MKNLTKLLGIIALAAVIGFAMVGCEQPTGSTTGKTLTGITLNTDSVKKAYIQNETLNLSGLVVTANYSDGSKAAVASYTADPASGATLSAIGSTTVTVSYTEGSVTKTADFSVTVTAKTLSGITAEYTGTTHVYPFTPLDSLKDHLAVTAQYNDGTSATLDAEDYALSGNLTAGTSTITVTYQGKETTFPVMVTAATIDSIAVAFDQDDETIYTSTPLNNLKQYLTVTATYTFTGSEETHEETLSAHEYTLSGELTAGTPTITVNYGDKTGNFTPTVTAVVLTGITAQYATATIYTSTPSDNLKQYLTVKAAYNDGNEKTLTANEYELSGTLTAGTSTITVSYTDDGVTKTDTFTLTVTAVVIASITANYTGGDVEINSDIDDLKDALTVTAHYNDGSTQPASDYTLSGDVTAIGQKTITVTYEGKTTTFIVTVVCSSHDWSSWTPTKNATVTENGEETLTCSICGTTGETTRILYAIGTTGLDFDLISINGGSNNAYRVHNKNTSNGTATGAIVIPAYYRPDASSQYLPVMRISNGTDTYGNNAFGGNTVTSITFAEGSQLIAIGSCAFYFCANLASINIPASVTSIGQQAFRGCTSLTSVTIPVGVTTISSLAFSECTSLASVTIPVGVTNIYDGAFYGCNLTSVTIPNSVTWIWDNAFSNCTSLTSVTIPGNVTTNSSSKPFTDCPNIQTVAFAEGSVSIANTFIDTVGITPANITSVYIPASVTSIGQSAFYGCGLTSVTFAEGSQLKTIDIMAFYACRSLTSIIIPAGVTSIGNNAFVNCSSLTSVTFNGTIASGSFSGTAFYPNMGDLRDKYFAAGGGIGTYTRPDGTTYTWTKQ
jgi:hypothetical protein